MLTLTTIAGKTIYVIEEQIVRVADRLSTDPDQRTYIHGPMNAPIIIEGDAQAFVTQMDTTGAFARLTRADGSRVWIRSDSASAVRAPTAQESQSHPELRSVVIVSGVDVPVTEDAETVLHAIQWT